MKKPRALIITNTDRFVVNFEKNNIKLLQENGYDVIVATKFLKYTREIKEMGVKIINIPIERNPFSKNNIRSFFKLNSFLKNNEIEIIHCHTPVGGFIGRLVGKLNKIKTIIYTAHGFHFFKGASLINWIVYYPIEKFLSRYTDVLITINHEDYKRAKNKFHAKKVEYIPGVGIDIEKIMNIRVNITEKRKELNLSDEDIILFSVGDININKNHKIIVEALRKIKNKNIKYLIAGVGEIQEKLEKLISDYNLQDNIKMLGYRKDVCELCKMSDVFILPSLREGLSVALMEALCCDLPIICSDIRGNRDLIVNGKNGFLVSNNVNKYIEAINNMIKNKGQYKVSKEINNRIKEEVNIKNVELKMRRIYNMLKSELKK